MTKTTRITDNDIDDLEEAEERRLHRMPGGDGPAPQWVPGAAAYFDLEVDNDEFEIEECRVTERSNGEGWDWSVRLRLDEGEQAWSASGWHSEREAAQRIAYKAVRHLKSGPRWPDSR